MKTETILKGIGLSILYSVSTLLMYPLLAELFDLQFAAKIIIMLSAACYLTQLITGHYRRPGGLVLWTLAVASLLVALTLKASVLTLLVLAAGTIWALRSYLCYTSTISVVFDLILIGSSASLAIWGFAATASIAAAVWCFFLIQALTAVIPKRSIRNASTRYDNCNGAFSRASQTAESALRSIESADSHS